MLGPQIKGKLKMVKQQMARMDIDISEISGLKWTGTNLIQMTTISTTVVKNHLEEMEL